MREQETIDQDKVLKVEYLASLVSLANGHQKFSAQRSQRVLEFFVKVLSILGNYLLLSNRANWINKNQRWAHLKTEVVRIFLDFVPKWRWRISLSTTGKFERLINFSRYRYTLHVSWKCGSFETNRFYNKTNKSSRTSSNKNKNKLESIVRSRSKPEYSRIRQNLITSPISLPGYGNWKSLSLTKKCESWISFSFKMTCFGITWKNWSFESYRLYNFENILKIIFNISSRRVKTESEESWEEIKTQWTKFFFEVTSTLIIIIFTLSLELDKLELDKTMQYWCSLVFPTKFSWSLNWIPEP